MSAVILHLSDIHIKTAADPILRRTQEIAACTFSFLPTASHVFVVVSGDIAFSGEPDQYGWAKCFFDGLRSSIQKETDSPVTFIVAPGNHDCDFNLNNATRKMLVKQLTESESPEVDASVIESCTALQGTFFKFREGLESTPDVEDDHLWRTSTHQVEGKAIAFDCLNISWVSQRQEEPGKLYFPVERYLDKRSNGADIRIVVMHHPLNWFGQNMYRPFRTFIRQLANIVISGHEHQGNVGINNDAESDKSAFVEGCVLQSDSKDLSDSSFNVVLLDLDKGQFSSTRFNWHGDRYASAEEGSWSDYHDLPAKRKNPFPIQSAFSGVLDDPGAFFRHPGRSNISLADVFVYPDMQHMGSDDRRRSYVSSSRLLNPEVIADGVLIEGEEKAGRTSLLYQFYREYHDRGFVPLLIHGKDIKKTSDESLKTLIRREVVRQYGKEHVVAFEQLPKAQKLLLLDDFDDGQNKTASARADLLCALKKRFARVVVTVGDMFEMREMLDGDGAKELLSLEHYQLLHFGFTLRAKLIEKWFSLSADGTVDEASFLARCDQAERLMNAVMTRSVIPSIPLYLLTLLQSIDSGRSGDFKDSALGYYYQYLLTEAFQQNGVRSNKLTELFQYCGHLAWYFHAQGKQELSEINLREFNAQFSKVWHTVDFSPRIEALLNARVLSRVGEDYAFRYPYIYYYLKGQYLSENLADLDIRAYIGRCCEHLYVREHANTVLFLAHHTNDEFVLNSISESLHGLFRGRAPVTFNGDMLAVTKLIEDAPKLSYSGEAPKDHRNRVNQIRDDQNDGHDGLLDKEEMSTELSLIAQMTMLFKTTEILGQVLKNQYSKIQRDRKHDLLKELFNGPLRALSDFYAYFGKNPDALVAEIDSALKKHGKGKDEEERKSIARKIVANLVQLVSFLFVMKAAEGASSDSLSEDVRDVVKHNNTLAFRLIQLGVCLDSPKPIPREKLKQLHHDAAHNIVAARLIQLMVLNRLYMFKTTEQDMQWLTDELKLNISVQHAITYRSSRARRLK